MAKSGLKLLLREYGPPGSDNSRSAVAEREKLEADLIAMENPKKGQGDPQDAKEAIEALVREVAEKRGYVKADERIGLNAQWVKSAEVPAELVPA